MKKVDLSEEQRRATSAPGNLLIRAGAGSGKTEVLARRFVALVAGDIEGHAPMSPEQIVAITFTEKATCDMKERIAEVLQDRVAGPRRGDPHHLRRALRALPNARISTIHAFCARILRENPIEAGIDPAFDLLDEYESKTFLESECCNLLVDALRAGDPGAIHLLGARRLRGASVYRKGGVEILADIVSQLHLMGKSTSWLREAAGDTARTLIKCDPTGKALELIRAIEELIEVRDAGGATGEALGTLCEQWPGYREMLEGFDSGAGEDSLVELRRLSDLIPAARGRVKEAVKAVRQLLNDDTSIGLGGELVSAYGGTRAAQPTIEVAELAAEVAGEIDEIKRRDAALTFDDLLLITERLFRNESAVRLRYRTAFRAVMVDEYQDTNPVQDSIVRHLTEPDTNGRAPELFIVGDEKQSIYRFRGTDVTVFNASRRCSPTPLPLRENRRSTSNILEFVNGLSAHVMRPGSEPAPAYRIVWKDDEHRLIPIRAPLHDRSVELILAAPDGTSGKRNSAAKREIEATFLAGRIRDLVASRHPVFDRKLETPRETRFGDIAILMRSFSDVAIYENAMRAASVPYYTVKGRGFFASREVLDLANLLTVIADPSDSIALAAVLRSPLFCLSDQCLLEIAIHASRIGRSLTWLFSAASPDFECLQEGKRDAIAAWKTIDALRHAARNASLTEVIERALDLTDFEAVMVAQADGRQRVANIRKLADLALRFETRRFFGVKDFTAHLRLLVDQEPNEPQAQVLSEDEDVVRLMTIHQAKGLEFPIAIVADIGRGSPVTPSDYLLSPERGLLLCDKIGSGREALPNPLIKEYRDLLVDQEDAESARLLYVAITRARDLLILSEGTTGGEWAKSVRAFVGDCQVAKFVASSQNEASVAIGKASVILRVAKAPAAAKLDTVATERAASTTSGELAALAAKRLEFRPPSECELVASPTELADFERCPRQYQLRHRLGLPERALFGDKVASATEMGTIAHAVLERLDPELRGAAREERIGQLISSLAAGTCLDRGALEALRIDLSRYAESRDPAERIVGREVPFFLSVADPDLTLFVRGRIDVLAESNQRLVVRDYKYARGRDADPETYRMQMECYALAAVGEYAGRDVAAELLFIRGDTVRRELPIPDADTIRRRLIAVAGEIVAAHALGQYPKKPSGPDACRGLGCGYVARCWSRREI